MRLRSLPWPTPIQGLELSGLASEEERARVFVNSGAGCRATYFNHAKKLQSPEAIPDITLVTSKPPIETHEEMLHATSRVRASAS
jgi:hypothetical protein